MNLYFLPPVLKAAVGQLNLNYLSEIRLRIRQPVIIEYAGEYKYINSFGASDKREGALVCEDVNSVLNAAMQRNVFVYSEQLKRAFITVDGGVRIGVGGEYVTDNGKITTVKRPTSLNIRIPHQVDGCADNVCKAIFSSGITSTLLFSVAGAGKTTMLREIARYAGGKLGNNVLVYDERDELAANFDIGENCDVVRGADKLCGFANAIRAMKPSVIICDELYGEDDYTAVRYATECGVAVIASTHVVNREKLQNLPFENFVRLTGISKNAVIYDKNFNIICNCGTCGNGWRAPK